MFITLTGKLGSGKSTVCELIQDKYGYQIYSTGVIQRRLAEKMGITTLELNKRMKTDTSFDEKIDNETVRVSEEKVGENLLFDSRLAFHFVKESFKVFAYVSPYEAADRVMGAHRGNVETYQNRDDARDQLLERSRVENERFQDKYHLNNLDYANYNLILDTTWSTPEQVMEEMMRVAAIYEKDHNIRLLGFAPKSLYPLVPADSLDRGQVEAMKKELQEGREPAPVTLSCDGIYHYVTAGMETVVAALELGLPYVTAVMGEDSWQTIAATFALANVNLADYEALGNFTYKDVPDCYRQAKTEA